MKFSTHIPGELYSPKCMLRTEYISEPALSKTKKAPSWEPFYFIQSIKDYFPFSDFSISAFKFESTSKSPKVDFS